MKLEIELSDAQLDEIANRAARILGSAPRPEGRPWTPKELAEATRQNVQTIRRAINAGRIKRVPATANMLIPESEARRIMEGKPA